MSENTPTENASNDLPPEKLPATWVKRDDVKPNDWNPNEMEQKRHKELRKSIFNTGWTQPIVVRETESENDSEPKYEIVDGEQRWKVAGSKAIQKSNELTPEENEAGAIPIHVIDIENEHAKISTVQHNRARGHVDINRLGDLLDDLKPDQLHQAKKTLHHDTDVLEMVIGDKTAPEKYGQQEDYEDTWRPMPATEENTDYENTSRSDNVTIHNTGESWEDDKMASSRSGGDRLSNDMDTKRLTIVVNETELEFIRKVYGYETAAQRLVTLTNAIVDHLDDFDTYSAETLPEIDTEDENGDDEIDTAETEDEDEDKDKNKD